MRGVNLDIYNAKSISPDVDYDLAKLLARVYSDFDSVFIPRIANLDKAIEIYKDLQEEAKEQNLVPFAITVNFDTVASILSGFDPYTTFNEDNIPTDASALADEELPLSMKAKAEYLENVRQFYTGEAYDEDLPSIEDLYSELSEGIDFDEIMSTFKPYNNPEFIFTHPCSLIVYEDGENLESSQAVLMLFLPVDKEFHALGLTPIGGIEDMPDHIELCMATQDWYENYGAIPTHVGENSLEIAINHDVLNTEEKALEFASKIVTVLGFLPECFENVGELASCLMQSNYFLLLWDSYIEDEEEEADAVFDEE